MIDRAGTMMRETGLAITLAIPFVMSACTMDAADRADSTRSRHADAATLAVVDTIALHESDELIHVLSTVRLDGPDRFVVADRRENQVRQIDRAGRALWNVGRSGAGPGEYDVPVVALRLPDATLLVAESMGRFTLLEGNPPRVIETIRTPFRRIEQVVSIGDSLLLVSAQTGAGLEAYSSPRLHVWHTGTRQIVRSFFSPFSQTPVRDAAIIGGFSTFAVLGDRIAATWSLSDSIYLYSTSGDHVRTLPFTSRFRTVRSEPPGRGAPAHEHTDWLGSFDYLAGTWWLDPEHIVLQYFNLLPHDRMSRERHLLIHSIRDGVTTEIRNTGRLLLVDPDRGQLLMLDPDAEAPNRWLLAEVRR